MNKTLNVGSLLLEKSLGRVYVVVKVVSTSEFSGGKVISGTKYILVAKDGAFFEISYESLEKSMTVLTMIGQKILYNGGSYGEVINYNNHPCVVYEYEGNTPIVFDTVDKVCLKLNIVKTNTGARGNWMGEISYTLLNVLNCNRYLASNGMRYILSKNSENGIHIMCKEGQATHTFKFSVGIMKVSDSNWKVVIPNEPQVVSVLGNPVLSVYGYEDVLDIVYTTVGRYSLNTVNLSFEVSKNDMFYRGWCVSRVKVNGF